MHTLSLNSEIRNVIGAIMPCHSPAQKPATEPSSRGESFRRFGPAAQALRKQIENRTTKAVITCDLVIRLFLPTGVGILPTCVGYRSRSANHSVVSMALRGANRLAVSESGINLLHDPLGPLNARRDQPVCSRETGSLSSITRIIRSAKTARDRARCYNSRHENNHRVVLLFLIRLMCSLVPHRF
jgi:hypothetical protein